MDTFPFPAKPTEKQAALEETIIRWGTTMLPLVIIGKILGILLIAAILISCNFNILSWVE